VYSQVCSKGADQGLWLIAEAIKHQAIVYKVDEQLSFPES